MPFYKTTPIPTFHDPVLVNNRSLTYMIDASYVDSDDSGDKIIKAGQFLVFNSTTNSAYPTGYMDDTTTNRGYTPLAGVLIEDLNLRNSDLPGSVLIDGWVDERFITDFGGATKVKAFGELSTETKAAIADTDIKIDKRPVDVESART